MLHLSQSEYLEMVKQLEESKNMEAEERARLEAEINAKREEVSESQQDFRFELMRPLIWNSRPVLVFVWYWKSTMT